MANIGDYRETCASFRWEVPERFNFGRDVVDAWAERDGGRGAMRWLGDGGEERRLTFRDVSLASNRFANVMRELEVGRGDRVMVVLGKVPEWQVMLTALIKVGAIVVPCVDQLRAKDLRYRASHSGAVAIVSAAPGTPEVEAMREEVPGVRRYLYLGGEREGWESCERLAGEASEEFAVEDTRSEEGALMLYTSGTTSHPKGALHTHAYTYAKRVQARYWLDLREDDLLWCTAATGWAKAVWNVFLGPWSHGVEFFMHEAPMRPAERLDLIGRYRPTVLCQAPTEYRVLANAPELEGADLTSVRHAVSAGEPLNSPVIERWRELHGITIYDGYGQTENSLLAGNFPGVPVRPGSMGRPSPGFDVRVIGPEGEEVPPGEAGDIALATPNPALTKGYWEQPEAMEAATRGRYYLTGDRAVRDRDGYLWFVGRSDDVILSAGYRIGPFEVEDALIGHPAVAESAVIGKPDDLRGQIVKAFVVLAAGYAPGDDLVGELQEHARRVTAPYKYPREIEFIDELPKTASGKIRRVELRRREMERAGASR